MQIIRPTPTSAVRCIAVSLQYKLAKISSLQMKSSLTAAQAARVCNEVFAAFDDSRALRFSKHSTRTSETKRLKLPRVLGRR
eukprot:15064-Heterococcus_DN1.PRE.4